MGSANYEGLRRLSTPGNDNEQATIDELCEYGRRVYQSYAKGDERHAFVPTLIPLHKEMQELGCNRAREQRSANSRPTKRQRPAA